jgi:chromosome segregation ATPase
LSRNEEANDGEESPLVRKLKQEKDEYESKVLSLSAMKEQTEKQLAEREAEVARLKQSTSDTTMKLKEESEQKQEVDQERLKDLEEELKTLKGQYQGKVQEIDELKKSSGQYDLDRF